MDSSRSHDPRSSQGGAYPRTVQQGGRPPQQPGYPAAPRPTSTYPYETQHAFAQPTPGHHEVSLQRPVPNRTGRRIAGVVAFLALTALSVPLHIAAVFFVYVEFESPGDPIMAVLLVSGAFLVSFAALLVTGVVAQVVGAFPGRWRARITFAALSGLLALGSAYIAALNLF